MRISRLFKRLRRWRSQAFRKRHSPAAFRTCRNAGNSVLTAEGTTSKGTGSISCEFEFLYFLQTQSRDFTDKGCINNIQLQLQCTDRLAYLSRSLVLCFEFLFCWLINILLLQLCMYLSPVNCIHTGRRMAVRFKHEKVILQDDFGGIALSIPYRVHCIDTLL